MRRWLPYCLLLLPYLLSGQSPADSLYNELPSEVEQLIEDQLANEASENEDFDLNFAFVVLDAYRKRPLDLNKATADELAELPFFNDIQVSQLLEYRQRMNGFLNQYELQVIPV
ncbi:MAG: helix-hairpin-helix domain-containing protein [Bacteroidota bacterium]